MEKVEISKELLKKILVYFSRDMEPPRSAFVDDAPEAVIYDELFNEFDADRLEDLFPGLFIFDDEAEN